MGNCCILAKYVRKKVTLSKHKRNIVLLLVGLDNSGKTATAKGLLGENARGTVPTVGFSTYNLSYKRYSVILYDLGGGPQIRDIWSQYYVDVHGIIYVIDASDPSRINESCAVIQDLLTHEKLKGKPLLLLANKQDVEGALDELDVVEKLNLEAIVNEQKCPTLVETCSAVPAPSSSKLRKAYHDPGIQNGFRWILNIIIKDYHSINTRVETDSQLAKTELIAEREKRRQRLEEQRRQQEEIEGTIIIPLRSSSPESNESRIITVQSSSDGTEGTQEDSQLAHPSDSQDSGYTMQNGDRDGERDSLNTIRSFDSAVQSMHNDKIEDNNISSTNGTTSHVRKHGLKAFMKRSNKTAPASAPAPAPADAQPVGGGFTRHKLPPLTPPPRHIKMFEVKSNKRPNLVKSASLSFDRSESEVTDEEMSLNLVRFPSDWKLLRHVEEREENLSTSQKKNDISSFGKTFIVRSRNLSAKNVADS